MLPKRSTKAKHPSRHCGQLSVANTCAWHLVADPIGISLVCLPLCGCTCESRSKETSAALDRPLAAASVTSLGNSGSKGNSEQASTPTPIEPTVLLSLPISAYHTAVYVDGDSNYLLTGAGAYRIRPKEKPSLFRLDLGEGAVMTSADFLYWSKGAIWSAAKSGGPSRRLGTVPDRPQFLVTDGGDFAWIDKNEDVGFTIQRLEGKHPRIIYRSPGSIDAATMLNAWVFFVERNADGAWRFGGISLAGGEPAFTERRRGRTPAMLATASDLYYYDGTTRDVRRLSPDFQHEDTIAKDLICSPIAVSQSVFCGQVDGLFEVSTRTKSPPRKLHDVRNSVTAIAASHGRVVWVSDVGQNQLAVNMLPLER